jgi:hypothetical protein
LKKLDRPQQGHWRHFWERLNHGIGISYAAIADHFISAAFAQRQKDQLSNLTQRSSESLISFNYEFEMLVREAFDKLPSDQTELIRTYLSAPSGRKLALATYNKQLRTFGQAMRLAMDKKRANDFLKLRASVCVASIWDALDVRLMSTASLAN